MHDALAFFVKAAAVAQLSGIFPIDKVIVLVVSQDKVVIGVPTY